MNEHTRATFDELLQDARTDRQRATLALRGMFAFYRLLQAAGLDMQGLEVPEGAVDWARVGALVQAAEARVAALPQAGAVGSAA